MTAAAAPGVWNRTLGAGLLASCLCLLALELVLSRIFSVLMWYYFVSLVISLALFGITASGLLVFLFPRRFPADAAPRWMGRASLALALSTLGLWGFFFLLARLPQLAYRVLAPFHQPHYEPFGAGMAGALLETEQLLPLAVLYLVSATPLQNRGHNFSLQAGHPNALAPGKRPYHTIIPTLATDAESGVLLASFGVMGGFMQPQGHLQVVVALADDRLDPQAAIDRPRFCILDGSAAGRVALEQGIPTETQHRLEQMEHPVTPVSGYNRSTFGRGQVIWRDPASGVLWAGSDPRADGCAMSI